MNQVRVRAPRRASGRASKRPTVTVVVPVKDDADVLEVCLRILREQTVPAEEIVVVDNGSDDRSADVAASFGARVVQHPGGGIPGASAAGYDAARSDVIARLDADCVPGRDWVEAVGEALRRRPEVCAVTGAASFGDGPRALRRLLAVGYLGAYFVLLTPALGHPPLFGSNFAMRRSAWQAVSAQVHRHDEDVHDDLDLAYHLGAQHRVRYVRGLRMRMSMRPFTSAGSFAVRLRRGMHTVIVHWPTEFPPVRWARRFRSLVARNRVIDHPDGGDGCTCVAG